MAYTVKEMFYTLQGEGGQAGRAAVFCRFSGCNLWSGREADRAAATCAFCDTDFVGTDGVGGGRFATAQALADAIAATWRGAPGGAPFVVFTGGEPLLQLDAAALAAVRARGFTCAIETNGTRVAPDGVDWICVSPKAGAPLVQTCGDELKLVYPQANLPPAVVEGLAFDHFWLQPMDGPARADNTRAAVAYCLAHPRWRLSLQTHKVIGIPQMYELSKQFRFEAAHTLHRSVEADASRRIHGHSYRVEVSLRGEPDPATGMVVDLSLLERALATARDGLDHRFLDDVEGLGPATMENLARWIWARIAPACPGLAVVAVYRDSSGDTCRYYGPQAAVENASSGTAQPDPQ